MVNGNGLLATAGRKLSIGKSAITLPMPALEAHCAIFSVKLESLLQFPEYVFFSEKRETLTY